MSSKTIMSRCTRIIFIVLTVLVLLPVSAMARANTILTISVVTKDPYLDMAVRRFQELNPGVTVQVKEYTSNPVPSGAMMVRIHESAVDIEKYVRAMNTELMSGRGSDIMILNHLPFETYADRGLLANIGQMMQTDSSFDLTKYYGNIFEALRYKGALYRLPVSIHIDMIVADQTVLAKSGVVIDDKAWTWKDFVNTSEFIIAESKRQGISEMYALAGMDERQLIASLVRENIHQLINWEKRTANFAGIEFQEILNLSKYLIDKRLVNINTNQASVNSLASRGMLIFNLMTIKNFRELQTAKLTFGGEIQLLVPPGNQGNISFTTDSMYGINQNSPNKALAWEFLKFMISDEMMVQRTLSGLPINKSVIPQLAQNAMQPAQTGGGMMAGVAGSGQPSAAGQNMILPPTREDIELVASLLDRVSYFNRTDQRVLSFVQDETVAFFRGQRTAEATARLVQNRVNIYINE